ncbi:MAG: trigger factor, partial [Lachnospiraceae bacterium]|nr:trigger factor [Lachnospiraceae bacterium]
PDDYVKLGKYKGFKVSRIASEISDADVEAELKDNIEYLLTPAEVTDRDKVEKGDIVNIDFIGKIDGEAFEGGSAEGYDLTIGSGQFIAGFEDGLIGIKVGEQTSLDLTFPDNYPNDKGLEGKPVVFEVSVNSIRRTPEPTDDNIKEATNGQFSTLEEYKKSIRDSLEKEAAEYADSAMYSDLWTQVVDNAQLLKNVPDSMIQDKMSIISENAKSYANMYGLDWEGYLSQIVGKTQEEFDSEAAEYAAKAVKESLVLMALTKAENIQLTQEEFDKAAKEYVELYNYGSVEEFLSSIDQDQFREYILKSKVHEFLADQAIIETE